MQARFERAEIVLETKSLHLCRLPPSLCLHTSSSPPAWTPPHPHPQQTNRDTSAATHIALRASEYRQLDNNHRQKKKKERRGRRGGSMSVALRANNDGHVSWKYKWGGEVGGGGGTLHGSSLKSSLNQGQRSRQEENNLFFPPLLFAACPHGRLNKRLI